MGLVSRATRLPLRLARLFDDGAARVRERLAATGALLIAGNLAAWGWALVAFGNRPFLIGTAFLAYGFGLRHGFDADHIAAIDNVTRRLMQQHKRPFTLGLFFSLGHATVVFALTAALALATAGLQHRCAVLKAIGGPAGTSVSALFLLAIGAANAVVLTQVWRAFRIVRNGGCMAADQLAAILERSGFLARPLRRAFALIRRSWHMYPLGLLFGLGFDTATEIGLLAIAAAQALHGPSIASILVFPALFTAGMALVDTTDSVLMVGAYGWAFVNPVRRLYYNVTVTLVSVVAAVVVGGIEALGLIVERFQLDGPIWGAIARVSGNFDWLGYAIVLLFAACWVVSLIIYRVKGYHRLEACG